MSNKKVDWTEQKIRQFWFSLLNKEKTGLMVRMDIPVSEGNEEAAVRLAQRFIADLSDKMSDKDRGYVFGSTNR